MGPSIDYAYKQGDEMFEEVMKLLKEKHNVDTPTGPFMRDRPEYEENKTKLREALRELIWIEACDSF